MGFGNAGYFTHQVDNFKPNFFSLTQIIKLKRKEKLEFKIIIKSFKSKTYLNLVLS